jgi:Spy/CpxP family protein refolding chaperone
MYRSMLIRAAIVALLAALVLPLAGFAQPPGGERDRGGPGGPGGFGGPFGGGGILGLAMREEVQQELQLVDEQQEKVQGLAEDMRAQARTEMREMFEQMRDLSDEERREQWGEIRTRFETLSSEYQDKLNKVLLPHQLERLKQIDVQTRMRYQGASALTSGALAESLSLTDEQKQKLEKRAEEVREELQEQIRQLQIDARKKLLDEVLTSEQRAKLETLMGEQFDLPEPRSDGGFRGRFGRGRDGGDRRGDGPPRNSNESI